LTRAIDAELAIELGADAIGFIHERSSPRYIGDGELKWIAALPPLPIKVAVFGKVDRPAARGLFDLTQGVEWEHNWEPSTKRIHVIRPRPSQKPEDLMGGIVPAAAVLLDGYSEHAYGGTGKQVDLGLAKELVLRSNMPVILAGGLTPDNVGEIVKIVRPFAVDVSSGIEHENRKGIKDHVKLKDFIQAVREANDTTNR